MSPNTRLRALRPICEKVSRLSTRVPAENAASTMVSR